MHIIIFSTDFIKVHIKAPNGKALTLDPNVDETIENIEAMIRDKAGISPDKEQQLIFNGKKLEKSCTLLDYSIQNGSTIHLGFQG